MIMGLAGNNRLRAVSTADILRPQDTTQEQIDARIAGYLNKCHWQLAQFYRVSPTNFAPAYTSLLMSHVCSNAVSREHTKSNADIYTVLCAVPHR